jgi:hypothetical protein
MAMDMSWVTSGVVMTDCSVWRKHGRSRTLGKNKIISMCSKIFFLLSLSSFTISTLEAVDWCNSDSLHPPSRPFHPANPHGRTEVR